MNNNQSLARVKQMGTALAFILYPICAGIAFAVHPNLMSLNISHDVQERSRNFMGIRFYTLDTF